MHIDSSLLGNLFNKRKVRIVELGVIQEFHKYLDTLPWFPQSLDWSAMPPSERFQLDADNENLAIQWVHQMAIGKHSHVVIAYQENEPGIMCSVEVLIWNLGPIFAGAPGKRYMFGADSLGTMWRYHFENLMEFDGGSVLTAIR